MQIEVLGIDLGKNACSLVGLERHTSVSGLGLAACQKGLSVGFNTASALVHELLEARDEKRLLRLQRQLAGYKLLIIGKCDRAGELRAKAAALFERFNAAFWDDELGFYAYALDGDKKKVLSVASNAGHCLWSGIVPRERAKIVVERLMAPDMWTGWGIRTLSAGNPAFNPYNYQTGSVWPHDNGIIAMGFKLYGFGAEAGRIAHDISIGASHFLLNQLPELYTAFPRDETTFPVQYIGARARPMCQKSRKSRQRLSGSLAA